MDPGEVIVAIAGMGTGVLIVGAIAWGAVQHARAKHQGGATTSLLEGQVAALRDQVDLIQHQLMETQERLDFTERLLAQGREPSQLRKG
jgi:hypothetical protein